MRNGRFIAVGVVAGFLLVGCGDSADKAAEELIKRGSDGQIDNVNIGDGGFSFETEDGSFSVDADGNVQVESDDGSFSMGGGSSSLADGFPNVPLPDGELLSSSKHSSGGETTYQAMFQVAADGAEIFEGLKSDYESAGYDGDNDSVTQGNGSYIAYASFAGDGHTVVVSVTGEDGESAVVSIVVTPAES